MRHLFICTLLCTLAIPHVPLGALRERASPSVRALVKTLSHENPYVRIYVAEALASIGPKASAATKDLARALGDPIPGVRWAAAEAIGSIGP